MLSINNNFVILYYLCILYTCITHINTTVLYKIQNNEYFIYFYLTNIMPSLMLNTSLNNFERGLLLLF